MRLPRPVWLALSLLIAVDTVATRRAWLSWGERAALVGVAAATLLAAALALGVTLRPRSRFWWLVAAASLLALLSWPLRWYPPVRAALALGSLAGLASLLAGLAPRRALAALGCSSLAALLLLAVSANLRFVAFTQAPLSGALLDGVRRLAPIPAAAAHAPARSAPDAAPVPSLGDAHIILVTIDALRADRLGRRTPHLDALAAHSLRFTRAYAAVPSTAFSITALLTGTPPDRLGDGSRTLAETLGARRWFTQAFYPAGLFFDGRSRLERQARTRFGFAWADTRTLDAPALTDAVLARLAQLRSDGEPRAFLWVHYFDVHEPYQAHPGLTDGDSAEARYDGEVAFVDRELGRLLDGIRRLERPVILCVTADHGEELGEHGGAYHGSSLYEEQIRVPLLLAAPGLEPRVIDEPVQLTDVAPALLALAAVPGGAPTLLGGGGDAHAQLGTLRMLVRDHWKLIHDSRGDLDELYDLDAIRASSTIGSTPRRAAPLHAALEQWFALATPDTLERTLKERRRRPARRGRARAGRAAGLFVAPHAARLLDDADAVVRAESALALAEMTDRAALPAPLVALLDEPEWRHRAAAGARPPARPARGAGARRGAGRHLAAAAQAGGALPRLAGRRRDRRSAGGRRG